MDIMRLLLIEDDKMLGESLQTLLRKSGYAVDWGRNTAFALDAIKTTSYDLALLDLGLPDGEGSSILKTLRRQKNNIPVIIITARDALDEKIKNLDLGADDYILKPFAFDELAARIRARLRRGDEGAMPKIIIGPLEINSIGKTCTLDGHAISLSQKEYAILSILAKHPNQYFSRAQLEDKIYDFGNEIESNALEYHIHNIRKKCRKDIIINHRGLGYKMGLTP